MTDRIRIAVADDHPIFRDGLRRLLALEPDMEVVGEASDGEEAIAVVGQSAPDILLLDLAMPRGSGLDVLRRLGHAQHGTRLLLLTASIEKPQVVQALRLGARGVVMKDSATQLLIKAVRSVMKGEYWVGRDSVADMLEYLRDNEAHPAAPGAKFRLTPRETDVVAAVVAGYTNRDIAQKFKISEDTVKHHLTNVFDKVGVSNRLELALFAINHKLVDLE
ncbi:MAG TPA: response regulator transcription factor [Terriglobales bacterium]|nr:response regulator transcription factor [Terriglobales bacterium]